MALAIGFAGLSAATTVDSAAAASINPFASLHNFTVVTEGDATLGSSGEFEGSLAAGGNVSYGQYNLNANKDGSALPQGVDGNDVQLFVGGTVNIGSGKFDVNAGWTRITNTAGLTITNSVRLSKPGQSGYVLTQGGHVQDTVAGNAQDSYTATPGAYASAFPASTFSTLDSYSDGYAALTASPDVVLVGPATNNGELHLSLTAGKTNVWNVASTIFTGATALNFDGGVAPNATTRLIINVSDANSGNLNAIRFNGGDYAPYVLWNFDNWTTLHVQGSAKFSGSILAPLAALTYSNGSDFNGQIAAKTFTIDVASEIHHFSYNQELPKADTVAGSWQTTGACDAPSNSLVVQAVAGVKYIWTAGPNSGTFSSYSGTALLGTYAFSVSVTDANLYTLGGPASFSTTFTAPTGCTPPPCIAASNVSYTYVAATNSGTVTVANPAGSSGKLCNGFWVTAVSWKYAGNGVWPQNLDQNNPMPENNGSFFVDEPGTYNYGAAVSCGQGDIYASYDAQPVPTAYLNGPHNPYAEHFLHDMGFSGQRPTYTQSPAGCNKVSPVAPVATPITACGTQGSLTYGPTTGVVYSLTVGNGISGLWEVTATPAPNFFFAGAQAVKFTGDLGTHTDCTLATKPILTPPVCDTTTGLVTSAYVTIPSTSGVSYRIDGTKYPAGTKVDLGVGPHTGTAETEAGWTNTGDSSWNLDVAPLADCDDPVEYVAPIITHEICDAPTGDIKGASILFEDVAFLTYELDGTPVVFPAGETTVSLPVATGTHTITVKTDSGYYLKGTNLLTEKDYPVTIDTPATCDDPVKYVAPDFTPETCDAVAGGVKDGAVTFASVPAHLTYVFDGKPVDATHLSFERPAGTYNLVVTAESGYYITGGGITATYPITIADPGKDCDEIAKIPLDPFPAHEECIAGSLTGEKTLGSITIVKAANVTWEISNDLDGVKHAVDTSGLGPNFVFPYVAGNYHVWATADAGYFIATPHSFPITIQKPALPCGLDDHAFLPTGATWTNQVCTPSGLVQPTISVQQFPGVTYFIDGVAVPKSTTTTTVKPGTYLITAAADDPIADTVSQSTWPPVLLTAAAAGLCGDLTTLAFTGATPGGWLILAILLLQAGLALMAIRFVRKRRAARHAAA